MDDLDMLEAVTASNLVSGATLSALVQALSAKGVFSPQEVREIYENALLMLESAQTTSPASQNVFAAARELIEQHLRPPSANK